VDRIKEATQTNIIMFPFYIYPIGINYKKTHNISLFRFTCQIQLTHVVSQITFIYIYIYIERERERERERDYKLSTN